MLNIFSLYMQKFVDFIKGSFVALPNQTASLHNFKQGSFPFLMKVILYAASISAIDKWEI